MIRIVGIDCQPDAAKDFNKWVEEVHIPMLLRFEGIKSVTRYQIAPGHSHDGLAFRTNEYPNYLTIIEFENEQALEAYDAKFSNSSALQDAQKNHAQLGFERKWRVDYRPLKTWGK